MARDDYDHRLSACWRNQDCNSCIHNKAGCGWCASSKSCVPASSIWNPVRYPDICPHWSERWELRTKTLGCNCSSITFLAVLITILCTIAGLVVLYGLAKVVAWINRVWGAGARGGWYLQIDDVGNRQEGLWLRRKWWLPRFFQSKSSKLSDDD
ncbi:hypothetical protein KVT40_003827 [Elsinoe batatas]|uniref:PSI domain-containing protein n=1 Tax=Elsinoe batatas TaxID=2601811 RepID=A0A8K0L3T6_9PEZI|nr:hypothetical protein KVT40_003827 [Elsinoe batatas]